jgi:hypothetical protein
MGKYILYIVIAFMIAFAANFFGVVRIPWLDLPFSSDGYRSGTERIQKTADDAMKDNAK